MFNLAIDNEWLYVNPIKKKTKFSVKHYQIRYLLQEEEQEIYQAASTVWKEIIFIALNTGLRQSNIRLLQGKNIKLDFRIIEITENKGNKHIKLPMNQKVYEFFKSKNLKENDYVFLNPKTNQPYDRQVFQKEWLKLVKKAGLENPIRFHDLRHTVGTRLAEAGMPINVIKEYMAHSDIKTTMQYVHTASSQLQKAAEVLNSYN
jgi:integrase